MGRFSEAALNHTGLSRQWNIRRGKMLLVLPTYLLTLQAVGLITSAAALGVCDKRLNLETPGSQLFSAPELVRSEQAHHRFRDSCMCH